MHETFGVIALGTSPGETKMWAVVRKNGITRPPCISWASCYINKNCMVKKRDFFRTPLHSTFPLGGSRWNLVGIGTEKLEWVWLPRGEKISKIRLFVLT